MTFGERLSEALNAVRMSQQEFADKCGMSKSMVSQYIHDRSVPKYENAKIMADCIGISFRWLMGEPVPMFEPNRRDEEELIEKYRQLNDKGKGKVHERAEELIELGYTKVRDQLLKKA